MLEPLVCSSGLSDPSSPSISASTAPRWSLLGGVDDGVGRARFGDEERAVVEAAEHRLDAEALQFVRLFRAAHEAAHLMAVARRAPPRSNRR